MIPVAVVLIVLVIVFTIAIIIGNPQSFDLQVFVARIPANITGVYVTGAVTMLVLAVAGWLLWTGFHRQRAHQKEIRALKAAAGGRTKAVSSRSDKATSSSQVTKGDTDSAGTRDRVVKASKGSAPSTSAETPVTDRKADPDPGPATAREERASSAERDKDRPSTAEERSRLLDEADELTRDDDDR